jgi:hypothetical protein
VVERGGVCARGAELGRVRARGVRVGGGGAAAFARRRRDGLARGDQAL